MAGDNSFLQIIDIDNQRNRHHLANGLGMRFYESSALWSAIRTHQVQRVEQARFTPSRHRGRKAVHYSRRKSPAALHFDILSTEPSGFIRQQSIEENPS
jgi:hypothetical protein